MVSSSFKREKINLRRLYKISERLWNRPRYHALYPSITMSSSGSIGSVTGGAPSGGSSGPKKGEHGRTEREQYHHARIAEEMEESREEHALEGDASDPAGRGSNWPEGQGSSSARATFEGDSVTATDVPRAHIPAQASGTPHYRPELDAITSSHSDNPLSSAIRGLTARDPKRLRELAEKTHNQPGMTGSA
jgi:hypothetical protein